MTRTRPILLAALALLCVANASGGTITQFTREKVNIFDESLTFIEKVDAWKVPIKIEDSSKQGYLGVRRNGNLVYLRVAEVIAQGLPPAECLRASADAPDRPHLAGSTGIGSGLGTGSAPCVTK
jgi:hypothetical protein